MKPETQELIDELLCAVPIEIDYKHDIFLRETNQYAQQSKKDITFTDIKLDIIHNQGEDKLKELEEKYVNLCTSRARGADKNLDDFFKDEIADKLTEFMLDVNAAKNKNLSGYLNKVKQNMKLVYQDGIQPPYQFGSLDVLLDTVAKSSVCYCMGGTDYSALNNINKTLKSKITPLFIRQVCAIICYTLLDFGNYVSIKTQNKQIGTNTGITTQIMRDLHNRCKLLGYSYFTSENKVFQYDKWSISPEEMLRRRSYIPPKMPMAYAGMKEGYLGYMISELQKQVTYSTFLDAFGGSGASSVQFRHNKDADYYINDFNYCIVSYYRVMLSDGKVFDEFIYKLDYLWKLHIEAFEIAVAYLHSLENQGKSYEDAKKIAGDEFHLFSNVFYDFYKKMSGFSCNVAERNRVLSTPLNKCTQLIDGVRSVKGKDYKFPKWLQDYAEKNISYIDAAVLFSYYAMHPVTGSIVGGVFSEKIIYKGDYSTKDELRQKFESFRSEFNSIIVDEFGASAMDLLKDKKYNHADALVYLDSPYIGTVGYTVKNKSSEEGKEVSQITKDNIGEDFYFEDFDMKDLLNSCKAFEGKYIFSCRENMVHSDIENMTTSKDDEKISSEKQKLLLNNYVWFWRFWQGTKDNVLFMYDLDFKPSYAYKRVDALLNDNAIKEWRSDLAEDLKNNIIAYLFECAFDGDDLEIMISNFDYTTPCFDNMYEYTNQEGYKKLPSNNIYKKRTDPIQNIPENGMFVQMPVSLMAKIVLSAMQVFIDKL